MNPWQMAQQIRYLLRKQRWQGGQGELVFGDAVNVFAGSTPDQEAIPHGFPFALIGIDTRSHDPDEPSLIQQEFSILVAAEVAGDHLGELAVIGGSRPEASSSAGAGIGEVVEQAHRAIQDLTGADGSRIMASATGGSASAPMQPGRHCVFEQLTVSAACTTEQYYDPPQDFRRSGSVWSWSGSHCEARFDFVRYRIGWVSGAVPATNYLDIEGVEYTGAERTATFAAVAGRAYSVFAEYSPRGGVRRLYSPGNQTGAYLIT